MKVIVAIVVYDRFQNIEEWIRCWKLCDKQEAELVIIHNFKNEEDKNKFKSLCDAHKVKYIPRNNIGMDIGALQDVFRGRLEGFSNEWDYLFWATDDVIPMSRRFLSQYLKQMQRPNIGVVCLELSKEVKLHIRTTGFMIDQQTACHVAFPTDPVITKADCYDFEHRTKDSFYEQIIRMGKQVVQVYPELRKSYLWDMHIRSHFKRKREHLIEFPR